MPAQSQMPALGYVTMGDYLGANQGVLDAGYQQDADKAHGMGDTLSAQLAPLGPAAIEYSSQTGKPTQPSSVEGYSDALATSQQAQELGRQYGSQYGMAGSSANPISGAQSFNAALEYGAHGNDYKSLGDYLGGLETPDQAIAAGSRFGMEQYGQMHQPGPFHGPLNQPTPGNPLPSHPPPYDMPATPPSNAPPYTGPQYKPGTGPRHLAPEPGPGLWRPKGAPKRRP